MLSIAFTVTLALVAHAEPLYYHHRDAAGVHHYRVPRVRTPAWDRDVPIPLAPRIVRRILRCRHMALDQERDELRFSTDDDVSGLIASRIDLVARGTGLVPYFEELHRRGHERSFGAEAPGPLRPSFTTTVPGRAPILLDYQLHDAGRSLRLKFHVSEFLLFPGGVGKKPSGEVVEFTLSRQGDEFRWEETARHDFDGSAAPPRHTSPTVGVDLVASSEPSTIRARLDRLTHHCLANDRYVVRWTGTPASNRVDTDSLYGSVRLFSVDLDGQSVWIGTREDRDEGAITVWLVR